MDDLYLAADLYDAVHLGPHKGELEFYQRLVARTGPRVLELACGTGRLSVPLAASGLTLTGLDFSAAMLEKAQRNAAEAGVSATFVLADMCQFNLGQQFDLVFIPINSICHLHTRAQVENCFRCVRQHLAPGGRFVVDVFNPSLSILSRDASRWYEVGEYTDAHGQPLKLVEQNRYDSATQINTITWRFEWGSGQVVTRTLTMRQYFPQELEALLAYNGFEIKHKYGKYGEKEFHADSLQQIVVAQVAS
jgi:SAM-dependent methyltransferase